MSREYLFPEYQKVSKKISLKMLDQKLSEQGFPATYAFAFFAMVIFKQTMEYTAIQSLTFICIKMGAWGDPRTMFLATNFVQNAMHPSILKLENI